MSIVLGLGLLASYAMHHPLLLDSFDELAHVGTLTRLLDSHAVFPTNSILPVSPYYPGLELATAATRWLTGLPLVVDQLIVLAAVRIVLVLAVFLVVERACRSSCAGGIGALVYAASPQFYGFDAQYAYETLALAFAAAVVYLLLVSIDAARPRIGRSFALALCCIGAVVITHHVTGWITMGFLVVWAVGLYLTTHWPPRSLADVSAPSGNGPETIGMTTRRAFVSRRRVQTVVVGVAAAFSLLVGGFWTLFVGRLLTQYVGPVFEAASADISAALGTGHGDRTLFKSAAGGGSPGWEILLILVAAATWCAVLLPSLYSVVFKRTVRGGALRYLPAVIAAVYPLTVLANISSSSKLVAERATTFIFFGVAVVVGAWLGVRIARRRRMIERVGTILVATIVFLGSTLFGFGPLPSLLPGPYRVGADELSLGSPSLAVAHWADTHLPAGAHVAVDKDNGVLLNAIGGVEPVTAESGLVNPELLFFDHSVTLFDIYLIRKADIRYIVVDDRLAQGAPLYGTYIADGEPSTHLTREQLNKFNRYPFMKRIYDNGPIQVYDVTSLLHPFARTAPAGAPVGGTGLNPGIFVLAVAVAALWARRLRRRVTQVHDMAHAAICGVVGALVVAVFGALLVRLAGVPPDTVALVVLLVFLVLSLRSDRRPSDFAVLLRRAAAAVRRRARLGPRPTSSAPTSVADPRAGRAGDEDPTGAPSGADEADTAPAPAGGRRARDVLLGALGLALFACGALLATVAAFKEYTPPPELSIVTSTSGHPVAEVQLGSAGPIAARIDVATGRKTVSLPPLARTTGPQRVDLPPALLRKGSRVLLVSGGHTLRAVDG